MVPNGRRRPKRQRGDRDFRKPALSHAELVTRMIDRGLTVHDVSRAERYLRHLGYYRLSPYTIPFQARDGSHRFHEGTSFDDVLDLYVFDRKLRLHVLDALERVEVAIRASVTDVMSEHVGGSHWYTVPTYFKDPQRHADLLRVVNVSVARQLEGAPEPVGDGTNYRSALEHYLVTYGRPELPPSWITVETLTIGQLSGLYRNIKSRSHRTAIAAPLGLNEAILKSWLSTYVRVRNICAHHGRLWNVGLGIYPKIPQDDRIRWLENEPDAVLPSYRKLLYPVLVSLQSVLHTISPRSSWGARLQDVLDEHAQVPLHAMGMFPGWHDDPFWGTQSERP